MTMSIELNETEEAEVELEEWLVEQAESGVPEIVLIGILRDYADDVERLGYVPRDVGEFRRVIRIWIPSGGCFSRREGVRRAVAVRLHLPYARETNQDSRCDTHRTDGTQSTEVPLPPATYRDAFEEAVEAGAKTMTAVNDIVTPYDFPYEAKECAETARPAASHERDIGPRRGPARPVY
jgi:hypothetical protein